MKKISLLFGSALMVLSVFITPVLAQGIIPPTNNHDSNVEIDCGKIEADSEDIGAKIHCGKVTLNDFPVLIIYLIQWILTLAGSISVIMIMVGAFQYMLGGVTDDKERGKKTLIYAIGGLIVAFMAWWIVELVQVWITS